MLYLLATFLLVVGVVVGLVGFFSTPFQGGRSGKRKHLFFVGVAILVVAITWLLWMGFWDVKHLVQMGSH